jgi:sporulation protein YlmC with PRC-barrel domain
MKRVIHAEDLIGRTVHDIENARVGRIEEIEVTTARDRCWVETFVLGARGLLQRLSFRGIGPLFIRSLAQEGQRRAIRVPWDKMDLSRPQRPKLRCRKDEL